MNNEISDISKRRLVQLASLLLQMGDCRVTSVSIGKKMNLSPSLVRKDISAIGFSGGISNGYDAKQLYLAISKQFELSESFDVKRCCIVGLGRFGSALLDDSIFFDSQFKVVAGFDTSVNRTEILRSSFPLYPAFKIEEIIKAENISYAILSSKNKDAQTLTDKLVNSNICGIVNYTDVILSVPNNINVEYVSPILALKTLRAMNKK